MSKVGGPRITEEIQTSTRVDLNRALNELIEPVQTLCFEVAKREMPACPDWTSVMLYPQILALFSQMGAIRKKYYPVLYWMAYYLNSEVAQVNAARHEAAELVRPVLEARQADYATRGAGVEKHDDFILWIMDNYRANGKTVTPDETVQNIFIVLFASMHGTSFIALQSLFGLIGTPGALAEIRGEIDHVVKKEPSGSPVWTRHMLGELKIMDSFMKETLRMKPFQ
ncbi:putative cytochrome p450 protein [Eutypa lata UCREL1]|uniref:Putative cytochrome p450 protein n=1 Tax=Eutypa lata (strain UCR-EL1) TaxID=1287681 RepID=M7TKS5_EUTLA|nr:putative cytochrome p450 protein [Eutypa lata UCREL1]